MNPNGMAWSRWLNGNDGETFVTTPKSLIWNRLVAVVLLTPGLLLVPGLPLSDVALSQVRLQAQEKAIAIEVGTTRADEKTTKENEEKYSGGAALKTDSDLEDSLKRASAFVAEKNYRNASILWDRVLEKSENSLITRDGETYISLVKQVEDTIRSLPPNGLQVYRISADGKARALMPGDAADADEDSLSKLVRLYFMSSIGDDAAYELGCRALDRRDFVAASRMFSKILNEHPDPSVEKNEVLIRAAIAAGNLGDTEAAEESLASVEVDGDEPAGILLANVKKHLTFLAESSGEVAETGESVTMRLSDPNRSGVMPALPTDALSGDLTQGYEFRFPFEFSSSKSDANLGKILRGGSNEEKLDSAVTALSQKWKAEKWFPTGQLLIVNDRIVFKSTNDLVCIDATGKSDLAYWHSLWLNHYEMDEASWNVKSYSTSSRNRNGTPIPIAFPKDAKESWYFFDRIHQSMTIHNGVVYTIEGDDYSLLDDSPPSRRRATGTTSINQPVNLTRSRINNLTAYNLRTGKVLWTRQAYEKEATTEDEDSSVSKVGFLGTPVPFGNLLLCPVTEGGAISIYAMDTAAKGKTVWKTFLCDDPSQGVNHFSSIEITIAGQEAYVTCGSGVLFALNAATGNIQFARRYKRDGTKRNVQTSYNQRQEMLLLDGWDDDVVVAHRNALVVMASDHDYLFAIDRRNGKFLWDAPRLPFDEDVSHAYCLGHYDNKLVMATNKSILCYNLAGDGKLHWYQKFGGNSYGRGFITANAVYVPVEDSIIKYDLATGKKLSQVGVNLGPENKVGNLFSDGKQIWVVGLNRVVALRSLRDRLVELATKIDAGDLSALAERLKIYAKLDENDKALADIKKLYDLQSADKVKAFSQLTTHIEETGVASQAPFEALKLLDEILTTESGNAALIDRVKQDYKLLFQVADASVSSDRAAAVSVVLDWSGFDISTGFDSSVTKFLTANPPTMGEITKVVSKADDKQIQLLIPVLAKIESSNETLATLLSSSTETIRIAAATELALKGDPVCLPAALELLNSENEKHRIRAFLILRNVTQADIQYDPNASAEDRQKSAEQWKQWLDENSETLKVKTPVQLRFGKILVATNSKIVELDLSADLKKGNELSGFDATDVSSTRSGNKVVAEYKTRKIRVVDLAGKTVTEIATQSPPQSARKLSNGHYLVAWQNNSQPIVELDEKGKVVWAAKVTGIARAAERLSNGNTLITLSNKVLEVDSNSNVVFELGRAQSVSSCQDARRLPNGNTLVSFGNYVSVFDKDKNQVLRIKASFLPKSAIQLADGRILVAHATGLRVYDKEGTKIGDDLINENVNSVWEY